jgi:hypothetical protein
MAQEYTIKCPECGATIEINNFTDWVKFESIKDFENLKNPGVYIIAFSEDEDFLERNKSFDFIEEIVYVGMTNSKKGLKGRLYQLYKELENEDNKQHHGGGQRMKFKFYQKYSSKEEIFKRLYVSVCHFNCNVESENPEDIRTKGKVAKLEYDCIAEYVKKFKKLPEFNNPKSPKK